MKQIKTVVLRLLINQEDPESLKGSIQAVTSAEVYLFDNQADLIRILQTIQNEPPIPLKITPED